MVSEMQKKSKNVKTWNCWPSPERLIKRCDSNGVTRRHTSDTGDLEAAENCRRRWCRKGFDLLLQSPFAVLLQKLLTTLNERIAPESSHGKNTSEQTMPVRLYFTTFATYHSQSQLLNCLSQLHQKITFDFGILQCSYSMSELKVPLLHFLLLVPP